MSSKAKNKKMKRTVSAVCWTQNDDGTFSLVIGSKKPDSALKKPSRGLEADCDSPDFNITDDTALNSLQPINQPVLSIKSTTTTKLPIKILKTDRSPNVIEYRQRQLIKRRDEMNTGYALNICHLF